MFSISLCHSGTHSDFHTQTCGGVHHVAWINDDETQVQIKVSGRYLMHLSVPEADSGLTVPAITLLIDKSSKNYCLCHYWSLSCFVFS